jgi:hypothetical protein
VKPWAAKKKEAEVSPRAAFEGGRNSFQPDTARPAAPYANPTLARVWELGWDLAQIQHRKSDCLASCPSCGHTERAL